MDIRIVSQGKYIKERQTKKLLYQKSSISKKNFITWFYFYIFRPSTEQMYINQYRFEAVQKIKKKYLIHKIKIIAVNF